MGRWILAFVVWAMGWAAVARASDTVVLLDVSGSRTDDLAERLTGEGLCSRDAEGRRVFDVARTEQWLASQPEAFATNQLARDLALLRAMKTDGMRVYPFTQDVLPRDPIDEGTAGRLVRQSLYENGGTSIGGALDFGLGEISKELELRAANAAPGKIRLMIFTDGIPGKSEPPFAEILARHPGLRRGAVATQFEIVFAASGLDVRQSLAAAVATAPIPMQVTTPEAASAPPEPVPTPQPTPVPTVAPTPIPPAQAAPHAAAVTTATAPAQKNGAGPYLLLLFIALVLAWFLFEVLPKRIPPSPAPTDLVLAVYAKPDARFPVRQKRFGPLVPRIRVLPAEETSTDFAMDVDEPDSCHVVRAAKGAVFLEDRHGKREPLVEGKPVAIGREWLAVRRVAGEGKKKHRS